MMSNYELEKQQDEFSDYPPSIMDDDNDFLFDDSEEDRRSIIVGICAQSKKIKAKPMEEILQRLEQFEFLQILIFSETLIHEKPIEEWPLCHVLISFHSKGFPLAKTQEYARLRTPFLINDLEKQWELLDRVRVHEILEEAGISQPRYGVIRRRLDENGQWETISQVNEQDDHLEIDGQVFMKPFVEKPVSAENHDVYIYFPSSAGGGSQRLFRKIGSRSSIYTSENRIRTDGSYIYEEFKPTDGTDVKVYTVGAEYAHAEARKSPGLDGKVDRDEFGKEVRYPVILSSEEKLIAMRICLTFKQTVCGFDLLRAEGKSFVCDVNGFSFVKNSIKYYDDCASILGHMIMRELAPALSIPYSLSYLPEDPPYVPTALGTRMELRCVIAVIRHGDRTPKQKMKMIVLHPLFFQLFEKYNGPKTGHLKLKHPGQLQEVLDIARTLLKEMDEKKLSKFPVSLETKGKLLQLKQVLELYGHFSGINRKIQLKYLPKGPQKKSSSEEVDDRPTQPSLLLIVKWGGELTQNGKGQAEALGKVFRKMYPGGQTGSGDRPDVGLLRLHSTFRHDLKIYASDEGRVQMTAAAFAKGLLALDGELAPILVQMVKSANTNGLLDNDADSTKEQQKVKETLHELLSIDRNFNQEDYQKIAPTQSRSLLASLEYMKNPVVLCKKIFEYIHEMTRFIRQRAAEEPSKTLYHSETWDLCLRRWCKLEKDFYNIPTDKFNISKVPDIYDSIKYDLLHNQADLNCPHAEDLYVSSKALADIVVPQEYGMTKDEKLSIARGIVMPLLRKIRADLQSNLTGILTHDEQVNKLDPSYSKGIQSPGRHVRTRLYFTSESHVHSLLNIIRYGGLLDSSMDEQWKRSLHYIDGVSELNYLTQIAIMLYEDSSEEENSERRFHVELHFSPGAYGCLDENSQSISPNSTNESSRTILPKSNRQAAHSPPRTTQNSTHVDEQQRRNSPAHINTEKSQPKTIQENESMHKMIRRANRNVEHEVLSSSLPRSTNFDFYPGKPKSLDNPETNIQQLSLSQVYYNTIHSATSDQRKSSYAPLTSLFSTRVISGATSTPDFNQLVQRKHGGLIFTETDVLAPLETLNTNLNYKILDQFLGNMTDSAFKPANVTTTTTNNRFHVELVDKFSDSSTKLHQNLMKFKAINELPERSMETSEPS